MLLPMIAAAESLLAESALVRTLAGVKSHVDFELETETEPFAALSWRGQNGTRWEQRAGGAGRKEEEEDEEKEE